MSKYITLDEHGAIQEIDLHTGETRTLTASLQDPGASLDLTKMQKVRDADGNLVYVPSSVSPEDLAKIQGANRTFPYTPLLADRICEMVAEGLTLPKIAQLEGMPTYSQMSRWRREISDFDKAYKLARQDRGEFFLQKALDEVETAYADSDAVSLAKLRSEMYKYAAKISAPGDFAEKSTIDARVAVGVLTIETGIRRDGDEGFFKDETQMITDDTPGDVDAI
jgi:hypothetical protein